ncbi:TlpA family protein disulfide reductase [Flagellimonas onchidii]|uniref:TlpA family protein disulfide reductase n=1 Tax=Flagellimonas onchidii TaxID=2562684 RepID=UPI0010A62CC3|nr:TlpA disulfide reductase family protein [Allomuricauda onchidii]
MKNLFPILILLILGACSQQEEKKDALISGKVLDPETKTMALISVNGEFRKEIPVNENGTFSDTLRNIQHIPYRLADGINNILLYLENGYNVHVKYNPKDFKNTLVFQGDGAAIDRYYVQKQNKYQEVAGNDFKSFYAQEESDFVAKVNEMSTAVENLLDSFDSIPENIREKEKRDIDHYSTTLLGEYKDFAHAAVTEDPDFKVSESFPDKRKEMSFLNQEDFDYSVMYKSLVHRHYQDQAKELAKNDSIDNNEAFFKIVEQIPVENIRNSIVHRGVLGNIPYTKDLDGYYNKFMSISTNDTHKEEITDSYNKLKKIVPGAISPAFEAYENHAGGESSLSDFKGKYVYIDVWASWCGPCIKEIPSLKEVEKSYHDKNIEFVSISIDTRRSYDAWQKMVTDKALGGTQLIADKAWESDFVQDYQIKGIPRFILIDPDGKIVNANAPRPSSEALKTTLTELGL